MPELPPIPADPNPGSDVPAPKFDGHEEPALVAGSITGLRSFNLYVTGTVGRPGAALAGVVYNRPMWKPGENIAIHQGPLRLRKHPDGLLVYTELEKDHQVASRGCTCGFYAYFGGHNTYYKPGWNVTGLIEGYGRVTVGTHGFKAGKARIVALVEPTPRWAKIAEAVFRLSPLRVTRLFNQAVEQYEVPVYKSIREALYNHPTTRPTS